jgi:hypothetical protein
MNQVTTAITEYNPIAAALATVEKYRGLVCDVTTPTGMAEAKAAHRDVAALRIALEKTRWKVKEDVVARGKLIDGEANRIFGLIAAIEDPIKKQIDAEEERVERERQTAIEAEQRRIADEDAARRKAEEQRLTDERAALAKERAAMEEDRRKRDAEEQARRAAAEAEDLARRQKIEEEERAAKARIAEEERVAKEAREAEEAKRRKVEEKERKKRLAEQAAKEAAEREQRRLEAEKADSRHLLQTFCDRFGHLHPELAEHIRGYLKS